MARSSSRVRVHIHSNSRAIGIKQYVQNSLKLIIERSFALYSVGHHTMLHPGTSTGSGRCFHRSVFIRRPPEVFHTSTSLSPAVLVRGVTSLYIDFDNPHSCRAISEQPREGAPHVNTITFWTECRGADRKGLSPRSAAETSRDTHLHEVLDTSRRI